MRKVSYYLGGDVSKGYCDFVILNESKKIAEPNFQLDDTPKGHQEMCRVLKTFRKKHPYADIYAGLESTGGYENNWYQLLWKLQDSFNLKVARLNPLMVKHHKKASLERMDTDKISARTIAQYLIAYPEKVETEYNKEDFFAPLKRHWKFVRLLKKQHAQLMNQLESLMYVAQPQMLKYCKDEVYAWTLEVLKRYPTADALAAAKTKDLIDIAYVTEVRAVELIRDAKTSVASAREPGIELIMQNAVQQIISLRQSIETQVKVMISSYNFPEMEILTSFKGIAEFSAFGLLIEIGAVERFLSVKNLASFFGLPPVFKESGDGKSEPRMSKRGRKEPRWILFNVAKSAVTSNEMIQQLYEGYQERGICKMAALGIIMHKILRIVYGMLKHKKKYDPKIDKANRERERERRIKKEKETETETKQKTTKKKNRRYQEYDPDAPLSRRQSKKREKMNENGETKIKKEQKSVKKKE